MKTEIEELVFKPIIGSIEDMDKIEEKEMKKMRPIKSTWYDLLINYITETLSKTAGGFKDEIVSLFDTNKPKQNVYGRTKKLNKPKTQIRIRNFFILKKKKEVKDRKLEIFGHFLKQEGKKERKKLEKKEEINNTLIKDWVIRDIRILFQQEEEDYYKPKIVRNFYNNMKVMVIEIKTYH